MSAENFPDDIRKFIIDHINSVEQLEVLLLFKREPAREWNAEELSRALFTAPQSVAARICDLQTRQLVAPSATDATRFRYAPQTPELDQIVTGLADAYASRRVSVINLIFSKPIDKIRTFADAFRLRENKNP